MIMIFAKTEQPALTPVHERPSSPLPGALELSTPAANGGAPGCPTRVQPNAGVSTYSPATSVKVSPG